MRENDNTVLGQVHICFYGVRADLDGAAECAQGVFRESSLVPAMGNGLR